MSAVEPARLLRCTFLGTGTSQGVPIIGSDHPVCLSADPRDQRLRVSVWLEWDGGSVVVDCGPDFRYQMLRSGCRKLDALLITHEHADHIAGLDDIRPFCHRQGPIPLYATPRVLQDLEHRYAYIFSEVNKYPGAPSVQVQAFEPGTAFVIGNRPIQSVPVWHGNWPVVGYRFGPLAYLTDVKTIEPAALALLEGIEVLVVNALRYEPHPTHLNVDEAIALARLTSARQVYFTHISHHMGFHAEVNAQLPKGFALAHDGLQLELTW